MPRQQPRERDLPQPEAEQVQPRRGPRIAGAIEGVGEHHAIRVEHIAIADNAQALGGDRRNRRIVGELIRDGVRERDEDEPGGAQKDQVVERRAPHRLLAALGLAGSQCLTDHRRGRVCQTPRRQEREDDDADGDLVSGKCLSAEGRVDPREPDPARHADKDLERARAREPQQRLHDGGIQLDLIAQNHHTAVAPPQPIQLIEHTGAAADRRRDRRAGQAKLRERSDAKDQQGTEHDVDRVREPEDAHRDRRVAGAAEDRIDQKDQQDDDVAAEHDARVGLSGRDDLGRGAHEAQQRGREDHAGNADDDRRDDAERDALHRRLRRARRIFLADAARHHGGHTDRQTHRGRVNERQHRLGEPDRGDGVRADVRDPEDVDHGEQRLHQHLEHHRHGEQDDGSADGS